MVKNNKVGKRKSVKEKKSKEKSTNMKRKDNGEDFLHKLEKADNIFERVLDTTLGKIFAAVIGTAFTVIIGTVISHGFAPIYTEVSAQVSSSTFCEINNGQVLAVVTESLGSLEVYLTNDNDGVIRVENICIYLHNYESVSDFKYRDDIGGQGNVEEAILLSAAISPDMTQTEAVLREEDDTKIQEGQRQENQNDERFIALEGKSADKYVIALDGEKEGIYEVSVKFDYIYQGKKRSISTDHLKFVYKNANSEDESAAVPAENQAAEFVGDEDAAWKDAYIQIVENLDQYFNVEDQTYIELKDMDADDVPELHFISANGAHGLLGTTKIFCYENGKISSIEGNYEGVESISPLSYKNMDTGETAWIVGYWDGVFELENIFRNGIDIRTVQIDNGVFNLEKIMEVTGTKYTNTAPTVFYIYDEEYTDINEFKKRAEESWNWVQEEPESIQLTVSPNLEYRPEESEIIDFINSYK